MFGRALDRQTLRYFEDLRREVQARRGARDRAAEAQTGVEDDARAPFLNFAIPTPQRHQTVIPGVGTLHDCCESAPIFSAVARRLLFSSLARKRAADGEARGRAEPAEAEAYVSRELARALEGLAFVEYDEEGARACRNSYYSVMNTFDALRSSDAFGQVSSFVARFSRLVDTSFDGADLDGDGRRAGKRAKVDVPAYGKQRGTLELFQKMILMHATYFIAAVILGDHAERVGAFLKMVFNTPEFSDATVRHFRQRATVFLVPRRHGKTWFLVPLIALALATFKGIKIGYTAHIRKATEPVFEEIGARLRQWFGASRVEHVKGETISFSFPDGSRSTIVFASSHNTNGIRGQDFNLLFVDEANFIRPEAVQTIIGFLNQTNCKIIFVSSTNTGKASTSFLYNLKGAADELLNVVTYICDDHMERVKAHTHATACSCYILNKPVFITMDGAMRSTAELFLPDSFMQEIIGGGGVAGARRDEPVFTKAAGDRFLLYRPSTVANQAVMAQDLYVYVDPAFTTNSMASGTGVAVVGRYRSDWIVFGLEHFFLSALTGNSAELIARCAAQCLAQIFAVHPRPFDAVRVAVEGNSSQDAAVSIAANIQRELDGLRAANVVCMPRSVLFHHVAPPGSDVAYPFFLLQKQKTAAFDHFIKRFNSGAVLASQELVSLTVRLQTDPVEYLLNQLKNLTEVVTGPSETRVFTGKRGGASDDMMVALVMAVYLSSLPPTSDAFAPLRAP
ncbi:DNA packaging terminase subunit 1 [Equid herpesvirus 6]|uniref:DNA packaging terminase subunit 1 n=1 Tax=Equid herpesvirus 6 TaxID=173566 RepID=A0A7S9YX40_9ALPH|nr:DNA packaging terminase subunit 1 [Equid herpesvirus 6]QPI70155.1 DNA packaging terminase subunit 1 [Equid herpesvirus 6]